VHFAYFAEGFWKLQARTPNVFPHWPADEKMMKSADNFAIFHGSSRKMRPTL
jgi:hypothetical protein